jgi:hypothetical protein
MIHGHLSKLALAAHAAFSRWAADTPLSRGHGNPLCFPCLAARPVPFCLTLKELVKTHLERTGVNVRRSRDFPAPDSNDTGAVFPSSTAISGAGSAAGTTRSSDSPFVTSLHPRSPSEARNVAAAAGASPVDPVSPLRFSEATAAGNPSHGHVSVDRIRESGGEDLGDDDRAGYSDSDREEDGGLALAAVGAGSARRKALDAALVDAWMREAAAVLVAKPEEDCTFSHAANGGRCGSRLRALRAMGFMRWVANSALRRCGSARALRKGAGPQRGRTRDQGPRQALRPNARLAKPVPWRAVRLRAFPG